MNSLTNDEKLLEEFLQILSEDIINKISIEFDLGGGQYADWLIDTFRNYENYIKKIMTHYDNQKIERKFNNFNNVFTKLNNFIIKNFSYVKTGGGMRYVLLPHLRKSEKQKDFKKWQQKYEVFNNYFQELLGTYRNFLTTVKREFSITLITTSGGNKSSQQIKVKGGEKTLLFLERNGNLYKKPKAEYCYPMDEKSQRHKIVRFLAGNSGYQTTPEIALNLEREDLKSLRTEIGKINNIVEGKLKIKKNLIEGKKESGYRISPKYKIILKNE